MIQIIRANITIMVTDMDASIRFYSEYLGLQLKRRFGDHWADIEGPGISIGLHPGRQAVQTGNSPQIAFSVHALDQAVLELENSGVKCSVKRDGKVQLAFFEDPDGHVLYLIEDAN